MKKDRVYNTELGDIALVAVARAIHMDILVFNKKNNRGSDGRKVSKCKN